MSLYGVRHGSIFTDNGHLSFDGNGLMIVSVLYLQKIDLTDRYQATIK